MTKSKAKPRFWPFTNLLFDNNLSKKAMLNAIASVLDYGARILVGFFVTPFLVAGLGDFFYGTWQMLNRLISYISPASGRPVQALKWTLASHQYSDDFEQKRHYVGSAIAIWILFLPIMGILGGILTWFVPYWIRTPGEFFWHVRLATILLVINLALTGLMGVPQSILQGENLGYKRMGLSAILAFVGGGLTLLALHLKTGIAGVSGAALITTLLSGGLFLKIMHNHTPWFGLAKPSYKQTSQFFRLSVWFLGWNLVMKLMMASDIVVLALLESVEAVTAYSLTKYAPETLIGMVAIIVFAITPGLGGMVGSGDIVKSMRVRNEIMSISWLIVTVLGATVLFWNRTFIGLWVGAEYYVGSISSLLIVVVFTQFSIIRNDSNFIDLTLRLQHKVLLGFMSASLSIALTVMLVGYFRLGIVGLCLGFIGGRSILSLGYPMLVGRFLGLSLSFQIKSALRPALTTFLLFSLASGLDSLAPANIWVGMREWTVFIFSASATFCVSLLLAFYIGLSEAQRKMILQRFRMMIISAGAR